MQPTGQTARDAYMRSLQTCRKFAFPQLYLTSRLFVGNGLDRSGQPCGYCKTPRRGGACPARGFTAITTIRVLCRGGIYAARAAVPVMQPTGQTARDAYMRSLQTCRKFAFPQLYLTSRLFVGNGLDRSGQPCGYCKTPRRGGVTPPYIARYKNVSACADTPNLNSPL